MVSRQRDHRHDDYLAGGFGVRHVGDTARPLPSGDDGSTANSTLFTMVPDGEGDNFSSRGDRGRDAEVKARQYGWVRGDGDPMYEPLTDSTKTGDAAKVQVTAKFDLAALAAKDGAAATENGPKHIDSAIAVLTAQREQLAILKGLDDRTSTTERPRQPRGRKLRTRCSTTCSAVLLPVKLKGDYATNATLQADALDLIDRVLDALSSNAKLEAALDPGGTGIFDHYQTSADDDNDSATADATDFGNFRYYDSAQRRNEVVSNSPFDPNRTGEGEEQRRLNGRTIGQFRGEVEHKVIAALGTTEFTRFGFWRRESTTSARRNDGEGPNVQSAHGGPGTFAYSPLDRSLVGTAENWASRAEAARDTGARR